MAANTIESAQLIGTRVLVSPKFIKGIEPNYKRINN